MQRLCLSLVVAVCLPAAGFAAAVPAGGGLLPAGYDPALLARGPGGVAAFGIPAIGANPAAPGDLDAAALGLAGGSWSGLYALEATLSLPTGFGVFSFAGRALPEDTDRDFSRLLDFRLGLAKPVAEGLLWGISLQGGHALLSGSSDWFASLSLGLLSLPGADAGEGFGWHRPRWGLALRHLGKPARFPGIDPLLGPQAVFGFGFDAFRSSGLVLSIEAELGFSPWEPVLTPGFGGEVRFFNLLALRAGFAPFREEQGPLTLGAGLILDAGDGFTPATAFHYATLMLGGERLHQFGLHWAFGARERRAPELRLEADRERISPPRDALSLAPATTDSERIVAWHCTVRNAAGRVVRRFSGEATAATGGGLGAVFTRLVSRLPHAELPATIVFNGLDESGRALPDGWYRYRFEAHDRRGNGTRREGRVLIDATAPHFGARPERTVFSPNGDGRFETLRFLLDGDGIEAGDLATLQIRDQSGRVVRSRSWTGRLPADWVWDGIADDGSPAPEGSYRTVLEAEDRTGNRFHKENAPFRLVRSFERASLRAVTPVFSPNGDGVIDNAIFEAGVSRDEGLEEWRLRIEDGSGRTAAHLSGGPPLPERLLFAGRDADGKVLPDGFYQAVLELAFDSGNRIVSPRQFLEIDTTPVRLEARADFTDFSPNGDGLQDEVTVTQRAVGKATDLVRLVILDAEGRALLRREWRLEAFPTRFVWNGLDVQGQAYPEGNYTYRLEAEDSVGNKSRLELPPLRLKTGLEQVVLEVTPAVISPGAGDGRGSARLTVKAGRPADVREQLVEVLDGGGRPVRSFRETAFRPTLVFDGRDDGGRILPDGQYTCRVRLRYVFGDLPASAPVGLLLDATPPSLTISCAEPAFSPNGDGRNDQLVITLAAKGDAEDRWEAAFHDATGKQVRAYAWTGTVPRELAWDGKDAATRPLPEGTYVFRMHGSDRAGNRVEKSLEGIQLVRGLETLTVEVTPPILSPALTNAFLINPRLEPPREPREWRIEIRDGAKRVVRRISGRGALPETVPWDGRDDAGRPVADGWYGGVLGCVFPHGNRVEAPLGELLVDGSPPTVSISRSGDDFTPDGDGIDDTLRLVVVLRDLTAVSEWRIAIFPYTDKPVRALHNEQGTSDERQVRRTVSWDGRLADGRAIGSLMPFRVLVEAVDVPGNHLRDTSFLFESGLLIDRSGETPSVRITAASPAFDRSAPAGLRLAARDRLVQLVRRILADPGRFRLRPGTWAEIRVGAAGDSEAARARAVLAALKEECLRRGVPAARLGEGAVVPIAVSAEEWIEVRFLQPDGF